VSDRLLTLFPGEAPLPAFRWNAEALVQLLLEPERLFPRLLADRGDRLPFLAIWLAGVAGAIDTLDSRMALGGRTELAEAGWPILWAALLVVGIVGGFVSWGVGGWRFRMRLRFSGAEEIEPRHARRVWVHARLVAGTASLVGMLAATFQYPSYTVASSEGGLGLLAGLVLWSHFVAYRGVTGCFPVRRARAAGGS
jgi:hypothetical protein